MIIDGLNLNHLRIFECVYRTRSMTDAARELHLTQSGVSQHMKTFEDNVGVKLFDRINQRLVPTQAATALFEKCSYSLQGIEKILAEIKAGEQQLAGVIRIGMPIEFGNNLIMPLIAKFCAQHPLVRFQMRLGFASEMNRSLLAGDIDFAFVDDFNMDKRVKTEKVYDEELELCASSAYVKSVGAPKHQRKYYESLNYVEYQEEEPILRMWFDHHLETKNLFLNVRAQVMDVQGVGRLIQNGVGAGILPTHLISNLESDGVELHRFRGCGKPLKNAISVAYLSERTHSPAAQSAMTAFKTALEGELSAKKGK